MWVSLEQEDKSRLDKETGGKNASVGVVIIKVRTIVYLIIYKIYLCHNIAEILLKLVLNKQSIYQSNY